MQSQAVAGKKRKGVKQNLTRLLTVQKNNVKCNPNIPNVALTFDNGPDRVILHVLDVFCSIELKPHLFSLVTTLTKILLLRIIMQRYDGQRNC
jgi:hypothetical protein